jgi:hypothetical protein
MLQLHKIITLGMPAKFRAISGTDRKAWSFVSIQAPSTVIVACVS